MSHLDFLGCDNAKISSCYYYATSYKARGFYSQTPEQLATAGASRNRREKERDEQELIRVAEMEKAVKKALVLKLSARSVVYTVYYT